MGCLARVPLVHEDQRLTHFAKVLQERINSALCGGGDTLDVQWTNFLFVDQNDPGVGTPPGERNYLTNKFQTIQDAVDSAQEGDVIYINPGTYVEDVDLSNVADNVTILGSGLETTTITNATPAPTIACTRAGLLGVLQGLTIREITVTNSEDIPCIYIDCGAAPTSFSDAALSLHRVRTNCTRAQGGEISINYVNSVHLNSVYTTESGIEIYNSNVTCQNSNIDGGGSFTYLTTDTQPSLGKLQSKFYSTVFSGSASLQLSDQAYAVFDEGCRVELLLEGALSRLGIDIESSPEIAFHGYVQSVDMTYISDGEYGLITVGNFDDAIIEGLFSFNAEDLNGDPWMVTARNAVFKTQSVEGIRCCANTAAPDSGRALFDMLGATFDQTALDTDNYAVDRTFHFIAARQLTENPSDNIIPISPPYISSGNNYTVHAELVNDDTSYPAIAIVAGSKLTNEFNAKCGPTAVNAAFQLIMQRQFLPI